MSANTVLNVWSSNLPEVANFGHVGSNSYVRFFDQNNRLGKAVAFGIRDLSVSLWNASTGSNLNDFRFGIGTSNPATFVDINGTLRCTSFIGNTDGSNITSGTIVKERLATSGVTVGTYGTSNFSASITVDTYGRVTSATNTLIRIHGSNVTGTIGAAVLPTSGVAANTYGLSNRIPRITVDTYGRITSALNCNLLLDTSSLTTGTLPTERGGTGIASWTTNSIPYATIGNDLTQSSTFVYNGANGYMGIGTSIPISELHVQGNALISGTVTCSNVTFIGSNGQFENITVESTVSTQITASNMGTGPALLVYQGGAQPLADFIDNETGVTVRIANNGSIGLGTSNPTTQLHIYNLDKTYDPVYIEASNRPFRITNAGFVGIGTIVPNEALDIWGKTKINSNLVVSEPATFEKTAFITTGLGVGSGGLRSDHLIDIFTDANMSGLQIAGTDSNIGVRLLRGTGSGASTTLYSGAIDVSHGFVLNCRNDNTVRHVFDTRTGNQYNAGSLGLGVQNPSSKLDVNGDVNVTSNIVVGTYIQLPTTGTATVPSIRFGAAANGAGIYSSNPAQIEFSTSNLQRMIITSNGNIGIGVSNPVFKLDVQSSNLLARIGGIDCFDYDYLQASGFPYESAYITGSRTTASRALEIGCSDNGFREEWINFINRNGGCNVITMGTKRIERVRITSAGNVGIGTDIPGTLLHVNGQVSVASNSSYSWATDLTTSIGRPASGTIALNIAGTEEVRVDSSLFKVNNLCTLGPGGNTGGDTAVTGGPFVKQGGWTTSSNLHTLSSTMIGIGDNSSGTLFIQVTNKGTPAGKTGNAMVSFIKTLGQSLDIFIISIHKSSTLGTFSITTNANNIVITTDTGCYCSWTSIGSY